MSNSNEDPPVEQVWKRIQQGIENIKKYEEEHAVAAEVGTNPIVAAKQATRKNLEEIQATVDWKRDEVHASDPQALSEFDGIVSKILEFFIQAGDPAWLRSTADAWLEDIAEPIAGKVKWFTENYMTTDNSWSGPAAEAYRDVLPLQEAAMDGVNKISRSLHDYLKDVASAIAAFWAGIKQALIQAGMHLVALLTSLFGVDTLLNPGDIIAQVIRDLADLVNQAIGEFNDALYKHRETADDMKSSNLTKTAFPEPAGSGGQRSWPLVGGGLSSAESDWKPRKR